MAGRDISVTHEALGPVRVMRTCGMMGEVVGKAAWICISHETTPAGVFEEVPAAAQGADEPTGCVAPRHAPGTAGVNSFTTAAKRGRANQLSRPWRVGHRGGFYKDTGEWSGQPLSGAHARCGQAIPLISPLFTVRPLRFLRYLYVRVFSAPDGRQRLQNLSENRISGAGTEGNEEKLRNATETNSWFECDLDPCPLLGGAQVHSQSAFAAPGSNSFQGQNAPGYRP